MEQPSAQETLDTIPIPGQPPKPAPEGARRKAPAKEVSTPKPEGLSEAKAAFEKLLEDQKAKKPKAEKKPAQEAVRFSEDAEEEKDEPEKPKELTGLRQRLALAGLPRKAIEQLDDQEVADAWKKQEERESAKDAAIQRAAELEKQLAPKATSGKSEPQAGVPTDELDLDDVVSELSAQFGEDESKALAGVLAKMLAPLQQENAQIKAVLQAARDKGIQDISASNRERLSERLPSLKENDKAWKTIHDLAVSASEKSPTKHTSPAGYFDEVFESLYGDVLKALAEKDAPDPSEEVARERAKLKASAVTVPSAQKRERALTPEEQSRRAFRHLYRHEGDVEGARRAAQIQ